MATASLDIAKPNPAAASGGASEAALVDGIEKIAELAPAAAPPGGRASLAGLTRDQLKAKLAEIGVPERELQMRAAQLWHWIYFRGATAFDEMTNVGKALRAAARRSLHARRGPRSSPSRSRRTARANGCCACRRPGRIDNAAPRSSASTSRRVDRGTLCVSSQVGCTLTCSFCHTGTQRLVRNLTAAEIAAQLVVARDRLGDWPGGDARPTG